MHVATGNEHQVRAQVTLTTGMYSIRLVYLIDGRKETLHCASTANDERRFSRDSPGYEDILGSLY